MNYERALLLAPGDADIRFNLQMARSKTIDKITPKSEMFFVTWYKSLVNLASVDQWASIAIVCIVVALISVLIYLFAPNWCCVKLVFIVLSYLFLVFVFSNILLMSKSRY